MTDCIYCERPLSGELGGWAHADCIRVVRADNDACQVADNDRLARVERRLRRQDRCPWQIQAQGWDGSAVYCGRQITGTGGDDPGLYCLEHQCEACGDEEGAAQERRERTDHLLALAGLREEI